MSRYRIANGLPFLGLFDAYGGMRDSDGVRVGTVVQAFRPPYETISDEVEWLLLKLDDADTTVLVPYAGATHVVDDKGDAVTLDMTNASKPQAVEQRLGFSATVIRSAPIHREDDELSMAVRRSAFMHYFPGLPDIQVAEVEPADEQLMLSLTERLTALPYATGRNPVPQACVLRNARGYVGVLHTSNYFKVIDWPLDGPATQLVCYMGKIGLSVRKGYLPNPDLSDADFSERSYVVGTLLLDEILASGEAGNTAFFDLVDPPAMNVLAAIYDCVSDGTVVMGASVRGPAYNCLFLLKLTSDTERFAFSQAFLPPADLCIDDVTYERRAELVDFATDFVAEELGTGPSQKFLLLFVSEDGTNVEFGAELSPHGAPKSDTSNPQIRLRFWAPEARTEIGELATFQLWAGQSVASGVLLSD